MILVSILLDVDGIFCLFHDNLPLDIDLAEHCRLFGKVLQGKRRFQDRLEIDPVLLMKVPLVNKILQVSKHSALKFYSLFDGGHVFRG